MNNKKVAVIVFSVFGLIGLNLFLFSTVQELIRGRNDIEVLIGMVIVPCLVMFDYLSVTKLYKLTKTTK
jgi:hypothetical protein